MKNETSTDIGDALVKDCQKSVILNSKMANLITKRKAWFKAMSILVTSDKFLGDYDWFFDEIKTDSANIANHSSFSKASISHDIMSFGKSEDYNYLDIINHTIGFYANEYKKEWLYSS